VIWPHWTLLALSSALFLGCYDISKKISVRNNAVLPVVWMATGFSLLFVSPAFVLSRLGTLSPGSTFYVSIPPTSLLAPIALKSLVIGTSWSLSYFALKHLPVSVVSPIRASAPFFTLLGAIIWLGEIPRPLQALGLFIILGSWFWFSFTGKKEGIHFMRNKWIGFIFLATLLGSLSGLMDRYFLQNSSIEPMSLQFWFLFLLWLFLGFVVLVFWVPRRQQNTPFQWTWGIPAVGLFLTLADIAWFNALTRPDALVALATGLRRTSVVVSFVVGGILFKELNKRQKAWAVLGILVGALLILRG